MRFQSAADFKSTKKTKPKQKVPKPGTKTRELWDLLQLHKGEVLTLPLETMYPCRIHTLRDFYGLDIRNLTKSNPVGRKRGGSKWVLAGEWIDNKYVDYIACNKQRLKKVEEAVNNEKHMVHSGPTSGT